MSSGVSRTRTEHRHRSSYRNAGPPKCAPCPNCSSGLQRCTPPPPCPWPWIHDGRGHHIASRKQPGASCPGRLRLTCGWSRTDPRSQDCSLRDRTRQGDSRCACPPCRREVSADTDGNRCNRPTDQDELPGTVCPPLRPTTPHPSWCPSSSRPTGTCKGVKCKHRATMHNTGIYVLPNANVFETKCTECESSGTHTTFRLCAMHVLLWPRSHTYQLQNT